MNILVDAHVFDEKHQGSRTYLKGLYSALIKQCPEWNFFLAAQDVENLKEEFGEFKNLVFVRLKSSNKFYRLMVELPRLIKNLKIDYTHFQYTIPPIRRGKYIVTIHDILFEQKEFKHFFPLKGRMVNHILHRYSGRSANVLLTVSEFSRQKLSEIYDIPLNKIFVTPNGIDSDFLKAAENNSPINESYILYVSRIEPRKNHLGLLKAFIETNLHKNYKLVFIGRKDIACPDLEQYIVKNKILLQDRLIRLENVSFRSLIDFYQNCALFVFPSFAEGFGIPPLEAMAFNKKILCSNTTAMSDFELPESVFFDPYNNEELKEKMIVQLSNEFELEAKYQKILSRYNWDTIATDFKAILLSDQSR